jgi:hypothetical protein
VSLTHEQALVEYDPADDLFGIGQEGENGRGRSCDLGLMPDRERTIDDHFGIHQSRLEDTVSAAFDRKPGSSQRFGEREYHP